jgi:hypothetical protein
MEFRQTEFRQTELRQTKFRRLSIALLAAAVSVPLCPAQIRGGFGRGTAHGLGFQRGTRSLNKGALWGAPFFDSDYYSGYDTPEPYIEENAPPQLVIVQSAPRDSQQKPKPGPLLIEWRGDRYVRLGDVADSQERATSSPDYAQSSAGSTQKQLTESQSGEVTPTVLVYRDGHHEEIADYTIAGGAIYIHSNYWQSGYWTKDVPLSALDASATVAANQQRGIKFLLPSAPNVVIASF